MVFMRQLGSGSHCGAQAKVSQCRVPDLGFCSGDKDKVPAVRVDVWVAGTGSGSQCVDQV